MRALFLALLLATPLQAKTFDEAFPGELTQVSEEYRSGIAALDILDGTVKLPGGAAQLTLPADLYALDAADSRYVLEKLWGNPPSPETLGMVFPRKAPPYAAEWGIEISFDPVGYVSDADAGAIDYDALLSELKAEALSGNDARRKEGFQAFEVLGWAEPPRYDPVERKLYWAELLHFEGESANTLNYKIRALGRRGVLQLNFIAGEEALPSIKAAAPEVLKMVSFTQGNTYADYIPDADTAAAVGIGGLIAGKAAAKIGLLAMLAVFLKKGVVLVLLVLGAAWSRIKRLLSRSKPVAAVPSEEPPPPPQP